jgi:hypothetical protein
MAWSGAPPPSGPPRRRSRLLMVVAIIVVVVLVLGVAAYFLTPPPSPIQVNTIYVDSPDNVCGLNGATASGFNASTGAQVGLSFNITGANGPVSGTLPCTIENVTATTPGFGLINVTTPLVIPANETVILSFTVVCPNSDYTGNLTLMMS